MMINTFFPCEMLTYYREHENQVDDKKQLKKLFKHNETAKNAFLEWAKVHNQLVEESPRLSKAKNIASKQTVKTFISEKLSFLKPEEKYFKLKENSTSIKLPYDLFLAKLINKEQMLSLHKELVNTVNHSKDHILRTLSYVDYFPKKRACLFNLDMLAISIPFLESLDEDSLIEVLSVKDEKGQTILFCPELFKIMIPLFKKKTQNVFIELITLEDNNGNMALHFGSIFKMAIEIMENFEGEHYPFIISHLLSKKNKDGNTILHLRGNLEIAMPLMKTMELTHLRRTISIGNNNEETALHAFEMDEKISDLLRAFDLTTLLEIFSKKNVHGNTPLHYEPIFKIAMSFLKDKNLNKQQIKAIIPALCTENNEGNTPLHYESLLRHAIYFLSKLETKYLQRCFAIKNKLDQAPTRTLYDLFDKYTAFSRINDDHQAENIEGHKLVEAIHSKLVTHKLQTSFPEIHTSHQLMIEK